MKVLVVEDSPICQKIFMLALSELGVEYEIAKDGVEALEKYKTGFSLIFLDYGLPRLNGAEVAGAIRAYEVFAGLRRTPIIGVTVLSGLIKEKALEIGFDEIYDKPTARDLKRIITKYRKILPLSNPNILDLS